MFHNPLVRSAAVALDTPGVVRAPQQDRSRRAVRRLLGAAEEAFAELGYDRASVRDIAARAGVSKGSLYQFFRNKQALLDAVVADLIDEVDRTFDDLAAVELDPERTGRTALESMVDHVVGRILELATRRPAFRTMFSGLAAAGPLADAGVRLRDRHRWHIEGLLSTADPAPPVGYEQVSTVCTEMVRGLLPRIVDAHGTVDDQLAPELSFAVTSYLASVKARTEAG